MTIGDQRGGNSFNRRALLGAGGAIGLSVFALGNGGSAFAVDRALKLNAQRAVSVSGTTLEQSAQAAKARYSRLVAGPGYALVVREDLVAASSGRDERRSALAAFVQFTDLHVVDAQSPMRVEYLDGLASSAFRPQEALSVHGASSLVQRVNALKAAPFTGRSLDCVVTTGDNTDNHENIELDWFLTVMSGGEFSANTGDPQMWQGVQSGADKNYYNPELPVQDQYKQAGFPQIPGYFSRIMATAESAGLDIPWYSVFGNHDDSIQGTLPSDWSLLAANYTGENKFSGFADPTVEKAFRAAIAQGQSLRTGEFTVVPFEKVVADQRRAPFTPVEYMKKHLDPKVAGAGPVGHGFNQESVDTGRGYYSFEISTQVVGISLDSTNRAGYTEGSLGQAQFQWLEETLKSGSSSYYDGWGFKVKRPTADKLFVVFSHHTIDSMNNLIPDPARLLELRRSGKDVRDLLKQFPNVMAWVNGHTHKNEVTAQPGPTPERGFWQINTASHIDFPQQARIIEVADNQDGTLSLFGTLIESAAPYQGSYSSGALDDLAALYRELAYNDIQASDASLGQPKDLNVELLLANPLR